MDPLTIGLGLAKIVPTIAKWVGGDKAERTTQKVIDIAKQVTGTATGVDALAAIQLDPQLAMQFEQSVMANETELERLYMQDRADARARDLRLHELGGNNTRADILAYGAGLAFAGVLTALMFVDFGEKDAMRDVLLVLVGTLAAIVKDIYGFEFGSSRGSKDKDYKDALSRSVKS